jgi:uncharacterized membrane protein YvbJ
MPFCSNCGAKLNYEAKFCPECGVATDVNQVNAERKIEYDGEIHKCPNCGEVLKAFISNCPVCGYELRNNRSSNSIKEFALKLNALEVKSEQESAASIFGNKASKINMEKISLIQQFTIPNNKEDITEFIMLAYSNIDTNVYGLKGNSPLLSKQRKLSDAWLSIFHQAYQKAVIVFGTSAEFAQVKNLNDDLCMEIKKKKRQLPIYFIVSIIIVIALFVFILYGLANAKDISNSFGK